MSRFVMPAVCLSGQGLARFQIFRLYHYLIVPSLYMLIAKEHHEKRLDESEAEIEPAAASEPEPVPEYAYPRWLVVLDRGRREFLAPF